MLGTQRNAVSALAVAAIITVVCIAGAAYMLVGRGNDAGAQVVHADGLDDDAILGARPVTIADGVAAFTDDSDALISVGTGNMTVISLAPSITELMVYVGAGDMLIGYDDNSRTIEGAPNVTAVSSWTGMDLEAITRLDPAIILASDMTTAKDVYDLRDRGFTVAYIDAKNISGMLEDVILVGDLTGHGDAAREKAADLLERVHAVTDRTLDDDVARPYVYVEYYPYWTYGPGSFGQSLIELAGGRNVGETGPEAYFEITSETVVSADPELIVYTKDDYTTTTDSDFAARQGWDGISAVKDGNIESMNGDWLSRPGPRLVDALEALAPMVHPELFAGA